MRRRLPDAGCRSAENLHKATGAVVLRPPVASCQLQQRPRLGQAMAEAAALTANARTTRRMRRIMTTNSARLECLGSRIESSQKVAPSTTPSVHEVKLSERSFRTGPLVYGIALGLGLFSGWVNQKVNDALLTALCVLAFSMLMGVWKKHRPWRWVLLVWIGVPIVLAYYHFVVRWPHTRGQVYAAFLQILAASAGANGGHFMREMIDHVFLKQDD